LSHGGCNPPSLRAIASKFYRVEDIEMCLCNAEKNPFSDNRAASYDFKAGFLSNEACVAAD